MTTDEIEIESSQSIFEPHPTLGKYVSHHPSNRIRLVMRAAIFYAIPVLILQALFWDVSDGAASRFLPAMFAAIALGAVWYTAHFWNREVILYEQGFTYQQGSQQGQFRYADIAILQPAVQRLGLVNVFQFTNFNYTLITIDDEVLRITNLFSDIRKLVTRLEGYIARDRLLIIQQALDKGETVDVGAGLRLSKSGLNYEGRELLWQDVGKRNIKDGNLILRTQNNDEWARVPIAELNNPVLLLAVLKHK
ncbi:MAG: hypothetical protein Q9P44_01075 [Anaerolineae bacterium]|nr:hypothetical protein [Anaerolineae bacterium]